MLSASLPETPPLSSPMAAPLATAKLSPTRKRGTDSMTQVGPVPRLRVGLVFLYLAGFRTLTSSATAQMLHLNLPRFGQLRRFGLLLHGAVDQGFDFRLGLGTGELLPLPTLSAAREDNQLRNRRPLKQL